MGTCRHAALLCGGLVALVIVSGCATPLQVSMRPFADGQNWMLTEPRTFTVGRTNRAITVPAGFVTDLASVPRSCQPVVPPDGTYRSAAILHDYLYWEQRTTRAEADQFFLASMRESNVKRSTRMLLYDAVRIGGAAAWERNEEERKAGLVRVIPPERRDIPPGMTWAEYRRQLQAGAAAVRAP